MQIKCINKLYTIANHYVFLFYNLYKSNISIKCIQIAKINIYELWICTTRNKIIL